MADKFEILVLEHYSDQALERLREVGEVVFLEQPTEDVLEAALPHADALLVRTRWQVTEGMLAQAEKLKVIGRGGVGVDNIDLAAAAQRGIPVVHTPAASTEAVGELTMGLILAAERRIVEGDAQVRGGQFEEARAVHLCRELNQSTLGIIGMGRIGSYVGRIAALGFGMSVIYNDIIDVEPLPFPASSATKAEIYENSDIVSLHVPLTEQTRGLIGHEALQQFRASALLVNTARGAVIDAAALASALQNGKLAAAAIDTFDPEPPPSDYPLLKAPNVVFSPHVGARSVSGLARMNDVVDDVIAVLQGREPKHPASLIDADSQPEASS